MSLREELDKLCPCWTYPYACGPLVCMCKQKMWSSTGATKPPPTCPACLWTGHQIAEQVNVLEMQLEAAGILFKRANEDLAEAQKEQSDHILTHDCKRRTVRALEDVIGP